MSDISKIKQELRRQADKNKAKILARFFKTGRGEYGEGDKFLGVVVPKQRRIVKETLQSLVVRSRISGSLEKRLLTTRLRTAMLDIQELLQSPWHEERLTALFILVEIYRLVSKDPTSPRLRGINRKKIFLFYIKNLSSINNWDLVDLSAPNIVGDYLLNYVGPTERKKILLKLVNSKNLWSRRVAMLATWPFIKNKQFTPILELAEFLVVKQKEAHDLMHKAIGWMLREVGKRDLGTLKDFLNKFSQELPRITWRYAIEKFPEAERLKYLKQKQRSF